MGYESSVFSLVFFTLALIYLFLGIYIVKLNQKSNINRMFLLICLSLSIWSLGFAMANSAPTMNAAFLWRRFSAIGWTILHSLTLHFIILLTREESTPIKNKSLFFIHIPGIISMYIFALSFDMSTIQYNLVNTAYGWTNIAGNNIYDWFFNVYYALYTIISLTILSKWKKRFEDKRNFQQTNLIFISVLISFLLGTLTDIITAGTFTEPLPQMSPLFILLPVGAMYYSAKHYGLIKSESMNKAEVILSKKDRNRMMKNIVVAFFVGGILSFIFEYLTLKDDVVVHLQYALARSGILFLLGFAILLIQKIKKESKKELFNIVILTLSIPIISLLFLEYSNKTVWVFPIIIIISSLIFNKKTLLISTTIVSIITQRLLWILKPNTLVQVDSYDYITRIGILILAYAVGSRVNNIYVSKIKENNYQIDFQKMNADLSFDFVNVNQENIEEKVNNSLFRIGSFFEVDRAYLFLINQKSNSMIYSNEWCNTGVKKSENSIKEISCGNFPWWMAQLEKNGIVYINDVSTMSENSKAEQKILQKKKVKSLISVPIEGDGKMQGFIVLDSINSIKHWSKENIKLLNILSNLIANGLMKLDSEREIEFMAYYDNLTKLPNRFLFSDRVNQAIHLAKRNGSFISIVFIDLDDFKDVNDTMGHHGGDVLLRKIGHKLVKHLRKTDTVARFGGDEFMILLNNINDYNDIENIVANLMTIFLNPFNFKNQDFFITASAGISIYPIDGNNSETLIKNADTAMYKAKARGKNQYALCTEKMKDEVKNNMILSNDLHKALKRNELIIYYQPQIDLKNGKISGVEALLRWFHPERGIISPRVFIPLAEKNGLINSIGQWVLETTCAQNKTWQNMGLPHIKMGVNLSVIQFINPNIANDVEKIIHSTGLNPKYLELEITENIAIKETSYVLNVLNRLKKIGVSIAIDDFGTEYSSLSRLKLLPIDRIKIDMQFIQGIEKSEKDRAITMVIINLAKNLSLNVLAEGVETIPQLEFLNQKMCDYVQGFYYYRPMPSKDIEALLKNSIKHDLMLQTQPYPL